MDGDIFPTTIKDRCVVLETASDVVRFSFIVQNTVSYLDLKVCENSRISSYFESLCDGCSSRRFRHFVNTEERCRQFFAPKRRLLYTLNLDLPKGRECGLKGDAPKSIHYRRCCRTPHIAAIELTCGFHAINLSNLLEEAFDIDSPNEKILKWILKVPFTGMPLLSRLEIATASKFIDCFYPEVTDFELFSNFLKQFDLLAYMREHEKPEVLEFLLYHARIRSGNISLDEEFDLEFISYCLIHQHYLNVEPILKYISDSEPTHSDYDGYLYEISLERPRLTEDVIERAAKSITEERIGRMAQIIYMFLDTQPSHLLYVYQEAASEALRLIWSSIPDACITLGELKDVFEAAFTEQELMDVFEFYVVAIGEWHEHVEPRSLQHLCRTLLRRTFQKNKLWIPDAIDRTGLPKKLQAFLNLENKFAAFCND